MGLLSSLKKAGSAIVSGAKAVGGVVGAVLNPIATVGSLAIQGVSAYKNYQLQKKQYRDQAAYNQQLMQREDNSVQRKVADLKAAGLSPVLAAGSGAQAHPMHPGQAPQIDAEASMIIDALRMQKDFQVADEQIKGMQVERSYKNSMERLANMQRIQAISNTMKNMTATEGQRIENLRRQLEYEAEKDYIDRARRSGAPLSPRSVPGKLYADYSSFWTNIEDRYITPTLERIRNFNNKNKGSRSVNSAQNQQSKKYRNKNVSRTRTGQALVNSNRDDHR